MIKFLSVEDNREAEIHCQLVVLYDEGNMTSQNVTWWIHEFKKGRIEVHVEKRSGCPSVVDDEILQKIESIYKDQCLKIDELPDLCSVIWRTIMCNTVMEKFGY